MAFTDQKTTQNFTAAEPRPDELPAAPEPPKRDERLKRKISRRTGGPRTAKGRLTASQNSIKHGAYAVAPRPSDEYYEFETQVNRHLKPVGFMEDELVSRIAYAMWRSKQIQKYTIESVSSAELDEAQLLRLAELVEFPFDEKYLPILNFPPNDFELQKRLADFWREAVEVESRSEVVDIAFADDRLRAIHKQGLKIFEQKGMHPINHEDFFTAMDRVMLDAQAGVSSLGLKLRESGAIEPLVDYWIFRNRLKISAMRRRVLVVNALQILCDPNIERAQNSADRSLNNLLNSYWLLKNTEMSTGRDINPHVPKQTTSHLIVKR